jgi:tRNA(fMet)-specific endonuclease VapC
VNKSLLDTDTLSGISKAYDRELLSTAERYLATYGAFTFSSVTVMEAVRGYYLAVRLERLREFIAGLADHEVLPFSMSTAELAGKIDADLLKAGQPIGRADPMIAASAIEHGLDLVTGNIKHFERIAALGYPLRLENWRRE